MAYEACKCEQHAPHVLGDGLSVDVHSVIRNYSHKNTNNWTKMSIFAKENCEKGLPLGKMAGTRQAKANAGNA
jgi:hypothetical protein